MIVNAIDSEDVEAKPRGIMCTQLMVNWSHWQSLREAWKQIDRGVIYSPLHKEN